MSSVFIMLYISVFNAVIWVQTEDTLILHRPSGGSRIFFREGGGAKGGGANHWATPTTLK